LYQNGPGLLDVTGKRVQHLFDAFALIQKYFLEVIYFLFHSSNRFTIKNGHVTYQNRILQSDSYQQAYQTGRSCYSEYGSSRTTDNSSSLNEKPKPKSTLSWFFTRYNSSKFTFHKLQSFI
jgi:carotenoid cleavage dioxygenase-like enzyme